jgi:hypothetical protein
VQIEKENEQRRLHQIKMANRWDGKPNYNKPIYHLIQHIRKESGLQGKK